MKPIIVAEIVTFDGANVRTRFSSAPEHFWDPVRAESWSVRADEVRSVQAPVIPLREYHGGPSIGRIVHLERRTSDGSLWCVCEVDEDVRPLPGRDYYLSVEASWDEGTGADVEIRGASLCAQSAMVGLAPAIFLRDGLDQHGRASWRMGAFQRLLLDHARASKRGAPIVVHNAPLANAEGNFFGISIATGRLELRSSTLAGISGRTIELIVMPYETETVVEHHGRMVREVCSRGAFTGIEHGGKVSVNRDHDMTRTVGKATAFDSDDPRGLVAELRIARTQLGDETLALAEDGVLDASAGFMVKAGGERWEQDRTRRRLNAVHLHHVALVPDPAYETARVLAVRNTTTPRLDRARLLTR